MKTCLKAIQLTVLLLLCPAVASAAAKITSVEAAFTADTNPARAQFDRDIESSNSILAGLSVALGSVALENDSGVDFDATLSADTHVDIEELGQTVGRVGAEWFKESDTGWAPLYTVRGELGFIDSETDIRDSAVVGIAVAGNWQPAPFFDYTLGARVDLRQAASDVFDTTKLQLSAVASFTPAARVILRSGFRVVVGNEVSTATPTLAIVNNADAIEPDNAFGGFDATRFAYRLDANSMLLEFGANFEVTPLVSMDLGYRYVNTQADDDIDYDRSLFALSLRYSFN